MAGQQDELTRLKNRINIELRKMESWQWPLLGAFALLQTFIAGLIISRLIAAPDMSGKEWETLCIADVSLVLFWD